MRCSADGSRPLLVCMFWSSSLEDLPEEVILCPPVGVFSGWGVLLLDPVVALTQASVITQAVSQHDEEVFVGTFDRYLDTDRQVSAVVGEARVGRCPVLRLGELEPPGERRDNLVEPFAAYSEVHVYVALGEAVRK
jgi:hypothetical protein